MNSSQTIQKGNHLNGLSSNDYLLALNEKHSRLFNSPATQGERQLYRVLNPLEVVAFKCMDGRLNLSIMTKTPFGLITPMRNVGAKFRLGWPHVRDVIVDQYEYALSKGRACLAIVTYHYSRGDNARGCAGFNGDTDAARRFASDFKRQLMETFGRGKAFYPILVGIETDLDALILHGDDESVSVDLSTVTDASVGNVTDILRRLYPNMPAREMEILPSFRPLVMGNIRHTQEIQAANRPITDIVHREWVLAFGRGFDWFHEPNTAVIVGTFDAELRKPLVTAAELLLKNLRAGRIPREAGVVLFSSAPYRELGYDYLAACEKAKWQNEFAMQVIEEEVPDLLPYVHQLTTVMNANTRKLEVLHRTECSVAA